MPNLISVEQGQHVTIELKSVQGTHSLTIPAYHVTSSQIGQGQTTRVHFVADKVGEFPIECSSECGGIHQRMQGTLVVVARPSL